MLRLASLLALSGGTAQAGGSIDCAAISQGALDVELGPVPSITRDVVLKAGDQLTFTFHTVEGPLGSLRLLAGSEPARLLLAGQNGATVSFVATRRGPHAFEFATDGAEAATFAANCVPAHLAGRSRTRQEAIVSRRASNLMREHAGQMQAPEDAAPLVASVDPGASQPEADVRFAAAKRGVALGSLPKSSGAEMWLQWHGKRYAFDGPDGPQPKGEVDGLGLGVDYKLQPGIMVGALAQFDQSGETIIGGPRSLSDQGWMVGPMTTVQLAPGLSLEARTAWGLTDPETADPTLRSSERHLVNARLANSQTFGPWRFTPSVSVNYLEETLNDHASVGEDAANTVGSGRVDIRPELAYRIDLDRSAFVEPKAAVGGFWDIHGLSGISPGSADEEMRLKAEAGVSIGVTDGAKLQAMGGIEEGAAGTADVWSGRVQLNVPLK